MATPAPPPTTVMSVEELVHELRATRRLMARVGATALLGFGTFTALFSKLVYEVDGQRGGDGGNHPFKKPLFMTFLSFVAMACCLVLHRFHGRHKPSQRCSFLPSSPPPTTEDWRSGAGGGGGGGGNGGVGGSSGAAANADNNSTLFTPAFTASDGGGDRDSLTESLLPSRQQHPQHPQRRRRGSSDDVRAAPSGTPSAVHPTNNASPSSSSAIVASTASSASSSSSSLLLSLLHLVPVTLADMLATALISFGLLYVPVSTFLMLRHGQLLFAAGIAVALRRRLNPLHRLGISLSFSGVALVGLSAILSAPQLRMRTLRGIGLVVASQLVQAAQLTFEGYFLQQVGAVGGFASPMVMVGAEGVLGKGRGGERAFQKQS